MKKFPAICYLAILLLFAACSRQEKYMPVINHGYLDLSEWDFEKDGIVKLNGTWEFYWKKLYTPQDFKNDSLISPPLFARVPGVWNSLVTNAEKYPGLGYGTYHLKIKLNRKYENLGIKILDCSSSYKMWINNTLVAKCGIVSSNLTEMKPQMIPGVLVFKVDTNHIELVVQVANNFHYRGGMWESIRLGTTRQVISARERSIIFTMFFAGTLFILFIYHLWIFLFRRKEKAALWFGVLCFVVLLRTLQVNERILYFFLPDLDLRFSYRIDFITPFSLIPFFFALYFYHLFERSVSQVIIKIIWAISLLVFFIILFAPAPLYTSLVVPFQIILYAIFICFFILTFNQVAVRKKGARLLLISGIIILLGGLNDILYLNLIINSIQVAHYAFFIFLVSQAYILSYKFAGAYNAVEDLSVNLERMVAVRTNELEKEIKKSDNLLLNILPAEVANELKQTGRTEAKTFSMVTVMFTDFKDFSKVSEKESAELLVAEIDFCFSGFDRIIQKYKIEKIKTVGDAYICVGGLPVLTYSHASDTVNAAIEIRDFMLARKKEKEAKGEIPFEIRIGIHTGPVVAGIVGVKKFAYDIWGDTVNIASRMESSGETGKVNISGTTFELVKDKFNCSHRGKILAKNKGEIDMYFAEIITA